MGMAEGGQVALFVDLDNVRLGLRDQFGAELRPQELMDRARSYGEAVVVARAYADFGHADVRSLRDKLVVAGIDDVDVPSRVVNGRTKDYVDFYMLMDIYDTLVERPDVQTFVLATGDDHFTRISAKLRNRHGKRVIILGVPGTISQRLRESATVTEELGAGEGEATASGDEVVPVSEQEIIRMAAELEESRPFVAEKYLVDVVLTRRPEVSRQAVSVAIKGLLASGALVKALVDTAAGQRRVIRLNREDERVRGVLAERRQAAG